MLNCPDCGNELKKGPRAPSLGHSKYLCNNANCKVVYCIFDNSGKLLKIVREGFACIYGFNTRKEGLLSKRQLYLREYHKKRYL